MNQKTGSLTRATKEKTQGTSYEKSCNQPVGIRIIAQLAAKHWLLFDRNTEEKSDEKIRGDEPGRTQDE